jgi:DNA mismatch repair protein MutS
MALIKEYFDLTNKYTQEYGDKTILLMQVGAFFEVYGYKDEDGNIFGSNIMNFSHICELNIAEKNVCVGNNNIVMAGFKDFLIDKYVRKIQDSSYTAVVYTQDENPIETNKKSGFNRCLEGIYSPGTYFSNDNTKLTNNIACVWVDMFENKLSKSKGSGSNQNVVVGMANIDILTGKSNIFEYKEKWVNNPTTFDELERFISIYNPNEFIIISNLPNNIIKDIVNYANVKTESIHIITTDLPITTEKMKRVQNCEKQTYQKEILSKFFNIQNFSLFLYDNCIATQAFCFLLDFIFQHNPYLVHKISEPHFDNFTDRLILANHTLKQLNIIDDDNYSGKCSSVLKILNGCLTSMGKRKFTHQFLNPTTNTDYLQREYDIIDYLLTKPNYDSYISFFSLKLKEIKDLSKFERQIFIKKISPKSFYTLYQNINTILSIYQFIESDTTIMNYLQNYLPIENIKAYCNEINAYITQYLNLDICKEIEQVSLSHFDNNFFNIGIDAELDNKIELIHITENKITAIQNYFSNLIKNKENKTKKETDYVKIHETDKNNIGLIATARRCKILEDALPVNKTTIQLTATNLSFDFIIQKGLIEYTKQNASNSFINDGQITHLCKTINNAKNSIKDLIFVIYNNFVETFGEKYYKNLEVIIQFITHIDIIYGKAFISKKYNYCKPSIDLTANKSFVEATNIRHCLIEQLDNDEFYVTNDITIGDGKTDGILLYGTNAVGKTSLIKALGISVIMAQAGLYVPCSDFHFKPYKYIFTRILGNDNIFKGLSTFAVEMSELRTILRLADENSLILGDELCSGTEIMSAISIFVAGITKLSQNKSSYIFATHLHEIVHYDEITCISSLKLKHMSVIYDKERDILIYDRKLKDGAGNNMYGLEVCKSLHLPADFLDLAYEIRMKYNPETSSMLSLKQSHFNSKKIMGICEKCGIHMSKEVHHLTHQSTADENGLIDINGYKVHKNSVANLMSLCEKCHDEFHENKGVKRVLKVKTSKGSLLV